LNEEWQLHSFETHHTIELHSFEAENNAASNFSPIYWQRSQRWSNTIFRLPLRSKA
jgi:hypothetical protein